LQPKNRDIKIGDLVAFHPSGISGGLTAAKYMARMSKRFDGRPGLVIMVMPPTGRSTNVVVQVENDCIVINRRYLKVMNEIR